MISGCRLRPSRWTLKRAARLAWKVLVASIVISWVLYWCLGWVLHYGLGMGIIPPAADTEARIVRAHHALNAFGSRHGRPPKSLEELEATGFLPSPARDGWGRPLIYSSGKEMPVRLGSFGADGLPGGDGDDADQFHEFFPWDAEGKFLPHDPSSFLR